MLLLFLLRISGKKYVNQIRARDAANHVSHMTSSLPFVIDTTPPVRVRMSGLGVNKVTDGSFEGTTASTDCLIQTGTSWTLSNTGTCVIVQQTALAQDGHTILVLQGTISQKVHLSTAGKYQLTFYTSTYYSNQVSMSANEGYVDINGEVNVFMLYNKPNTHTYSWQSHKVLLHLNKGEHLLTFGTVNERSIYSLDNVSMQQIMLSNDVHESNTDHETHVRTHSVFIHDWSSLHADWHFEDEESGITDYQWGIGTKYQHIFCTLV